MAGVPPTLLPERCCISCAPIATRRRTGYSSLNVGRVPFASTFTWLVKGKAWDVERGGYAKRSCPRHPHPHPHAHPNAFGVFARTVECGVVVRVHVLVLTGKNACACACE